MDFLNIFYTNSSWRLGLILVAGVFVWLFVWRYDPGKIDRTKKSRNK